MMRSTSRTGIRDEWLIDLGSLAQTLCRIVNDFATYTAVAMAVPNLRRKEVRCGVEDILTVLICPLVIRVKSV